MMIATTRADTPGFSSLLIGAISVADFFCTGTYILLSSTTVASSEGQQQQHAAHNTSSKVHYKKSIVQDTMSIIGCSESHAQL